MKVGANILSQYRMKLGANVKLVLMNVGANVSVSNESGANIKSVGIKWKWAQMLGQYEMKICANVKSVSNENGRTNVKYQMKVGANVKSASSEIGCKF